MSPCWLLSYSLTVYSLHYTADSDILRTCPCQRMLWKTPLRSTCKQWGGKSACNCGQYWYLHLLMFPTEFYSLQSRKAQVLVSWTEEAWMQVTWELLLDSFFSWSNECYFFTRIDKVFTKFLTWNSFFWTIQKYRTCLELNTHRTETFYSGLTDL